MDSGLWKWKADCISYSVGGYCTFQTSGFSKQLLLQCNAVTVQSMQFSPNQWTFFLIICSVAWVKIFCLKRLSYNSKTFRVKQNRSIHTGSGPRVCLPPWVANVRCLGKRRIRQAYMVFFFLPHYSSCCPNSCGWGTSFIISSMFFLPKTFPFVPRTQKTFLCLICYSKFYLIFLNQFLKRCRVRLSTDIATMPHAK